MGGGGAAGHAPCAAPEWPAASDAATPSILRSRHQQACSGPEKIRKTGRGRDVPPQFSLGRKQELAVAVRGRTSFLG